MQQAPAGEHNMICNFFIILSMDGEVKLIYYENHKSDNDGNQFYLTFTLPLDAYIQLVYVYIIYYLVTVYEKPQMLVFVIKAFHFHILR